MQQVHHNDRTFQKWLMEDAAFMEGNAGWVSSINSDSALEAELEAMKMALQWAQELEWDNFDFFFDCQDWRVAKDREAVIINQASGLEPTLGIQPPQKKKLETKQIPQRNESSTRIRGRALHPQVSQHV
uniref:Uncharacterized protein n=1 Tax=Cannabis sativa TaxID=3483 RepID=A0A803QJW7_CANSA